MRSQKIKSFLNWTKHMNHDQSIKIMKEYFNEILNEELEVMDQIRDLSLDYQDDGCKFLISIKYKHLNKTVPIYLCGYSNKCLFIGDLDRNSKSELEQILENINNNINGEMFILIELEKFNEKQKNQFHREIESHFDDVWTISMNDTDWKENGESFKSVEEFIIKLNKK